MSFLLLYFKFRRKVLKMFSLKQKLKNTLTGTARSERCSDSINNETEKRENISEKFPNISDEKRRLNIQEVGQKEITPDY